MNAISNLFSTDLVQTLGWTLVHSLWQGLLVLSLTLLILRYIPTRRSNTRYHIALSSLGLMVVLSASTFLVLNYLNEKTIAGFVIHSATDSTSGVAGNSLPTIFGWLQFQHLLQQNMVFLVGFWIVGSLLFSLRVVGGGFYLFLVQRTSLDLQSEWQNRLKELSSQLGIARVVRLAESTRIHAPLVLGYLKPVILLPAGMISGLSGEQIEMILLHELTHIRRNDYIVNVVQVILESIFFFNPFTWMLSGIIRKEREHCCDDAVIQWQGDPLAYATTLAQLEEARLYKMPLGVAFAENKNQLLNRIKRLMEKSVKKYSARERMIPALLIVIGLVCASWLTIGVRPQEKKIHTKEIRSDTGKHKTERSASYSRKKVTTLDEHGEPHEEITEAFIGDEELRALMAVDDMEVPVALRALMAGPALEMPIPLPFDIGLDTIPFPPAPLLYPGGDWNKAFREEFQKEFKEQFGDFYKNNQRELNQIMEEVQQNINQRFDEQWSAKMEEQIKAQEKIMHEQFDHMKVHEELMAMNEETVRKFEQDAKAWEKENSIHMRELEQKMKAMEDQMHQFEKAVKEQLVKDGYLKAGDKIEHLNWDDDGVIEINGKQIKESDRKKYDELHRKYFKETGNFHYVE